MRTLALSMLMTATALATGCSFYARDADSYRKATRELIETKNGSIKSCYDAELKTDKKASGKVVLDFKVAAETGKLSSVKVNKKKTTAPESLASCVTKALDGLALNPPDKRDGDASFTWEFEAKP
jgi:outer membrane lipopolysaccharide assembly protein LptE/RlpB